MVSRIFAIAILVCAVGLLVFDLVTKAFHPSAALIGLGLALIGFIGNFIIAPGSTQDGMWAYILNHTNLATGKIEATQLNIGAYMILASGFFTISYYTKCMKSGT